MVETSSTTVTKITLDTNILFYAFDSKEVGKHLLAKRILAACYDMAVPISLQCLGEFYRSATKKHLVSPAEASTIVEDVRKGMPIIQPGEIDLVAAMRIHQQHGLQFFDCLLIATTARAGCTTLFFEDLQHNQVIEGLTIVNPFKLSHQELEALLA